MEKFQKIISFAFISMAFFSFAPTGVQAQSCDPCYDPCAMNFDVGVDLLWWKPCAGDLAYCAERDGSDVKIKNFCLDWEPGIRFFLGRADMICGWDFSASYTYLNSCTSSSTEEDGELMPAFAHPGFTTNRWHDEGKGTWDSCYHEWDIMIGFDSCCDQCHQLSYMFGIAGLDLDQEFKAKLEDTNDEVMQTKWDSDYWGVGFRFGTAYTRQLLDCLSFFAKGHATILAGEACMKTSFDSQGGDSETDHKFKEEDYCQIVPGYHLAAGINYDMCACDWDFSLRFGYEFLSWSNLPNRRTYVSDQSVGSSQERAISTAASSRTFGYHGLFAGLAMSF